MQEFNTKTIREIALEYPQTVPVFEEFKIDYCCGGRKPLAEACENLGVDETLVWQKIENSIKGIQESGKSQVYPEHKKPTELIDYIVEKHHVYTREAIERLTPLMDKVCARHGEQRAELFEIQKIFRLLSEELLAHMQKEEMVLFPYIKVLAAVVSTNIPVAQPHFQTVRNPVRMMMMEHDAAGDFLREMRSASNDYKLPEGACPSYTALYFGLEELERDLHRHIHLENNALFPQAIEIEEKVLGKKAAEAGAGRACHPSCH
jgi:regulator of cell morphogenesis and NO signaling